MACIYDTNRGKAERKGDKNLTQQNVNSDQQGKLEN